MCIKSYCYELAARASYRDTSSALIIRVLICAHIIASLACILTSLYILDIIFLRLLLAFDTHKFISMNFRTWCRGTWQASANEYKGEPVGAYVTLVTRYVLYNTSYYNQYTRSYKKK